MRRGELTPQARRTPEVRFDPDAAVARVRRRHDDRAAALGSEWQAWKAHYDDADRRRAGARR